MNKRILLIILLLAILPTALADFTADSTAEIRESCPTEINLFTIPITNTDSANSIYTVSLSGSAAKWAVAAPPGFVLQPGESQTVFVYLTPSKDARIGSYSLKITITDGKTSKYITETINIKECFGAKLLVSETEKKVCSCEEADFLFNLQNTGEFTENFEVSLAGSAGRWAAVSERFVRLASGESKDITVHVAPECDNIGSFGLTLTAKSEKTEAVASANAGLKVEGCYDFAAAPEQNYYSFCENTEIKVPITIENKGSSADTYSLSTTGPSWIALEKKEVNINGGSGAEVNLVAFPSYGISGNFPVKVNVKSEKGGKTETVSLDLNVLICHSTTVNLDAATDSLCPGSEATHKIVLANAGNFAETYSLTISGADWASLSANSVALEASESKNIDLVLSPRVDSEAGKYNIVVTAKAQGTSGTSDSSGILIDVLSKERCFGVNLLPQLEKTEVEYGGTSLVPITVENLGMQTIIYTLDVAGNGASYVQLQPAALEIAGGKSKKTYLYISAPDESAAGRYVATISARDDTGIVSSSVDITFNVVEKLSGEAVSSITGGAADINETIGWLNNWKEKINSKAKAGLSLIKSKTLAAFSAVKGKIGQIPYVAKSYKYLKEHWYVGIGIIIVIVLMLAGIIAWLTSKGKSDEFIDDFYDAPKQAPKVKKDKGPGLWKRFKDWINADDLEEFEVGWEVDAKKVKVLDKPKPVKKKDGLWKKFIDWLEEDVPAKPTKVKSPKIIKKKPAKKDGLWKKFIDWLEAEETSESKPKKPEKPKAAKKNNGKSAWSKFTDWLNEGEEDFFKPEPEEDDIIPKTKTPKAQKRKGKGIWNKFLDWLEEEETPKKPKKVNKAPKAPKTRRSKLLVPSAKLKEKGKGAWKKFMDWLEEE